MLPLWGHAVLELLDHAHLSVAQLAAEIGKNRAITHRHLKGERNPSPDMVRRINRALAQVLKSIDVENYLNAVALANGIIRATAGDVEMVFEGATLALEIAPRYFRDGYQEEIRKELSGWEPGRRRALDLALNRMMRRRLIRHIDGVLPASKTYFEETRSVCEAQGLKLDRWMRTEDELRRIRLRDEFLQTIRKALAEASSDIATRNRLEGVVLNAYHELANAEIERMGILQQSLEALTGLVVDVRRQDKALEKAVAKLKTLARKRST